MSLYESIVLKRPKIALLALAAGLSFLGYWIKDFRLDASTDTLVLEHDEDLRYYRKMSQRYGRTDFIFIAYTPSENLFSKESLNRIKSLREELKKLPRVSSVVTLLDVPLLQNPPGSLNELKNNIKTLESPKAKISLAIAEFQNSPIYQKLVVSPDLKSTAIVVNFLSEKDQKLIDRREALRELLRERRLTVSESEELRRVEKEYRRYKDKVRQARQEDLAAIRKIVQPYRQEAKIVLGGVPMIVHDIISFIKNDLKFFGLGMLLFLVMTLGVIFRRKRFVILPLLSCIFSVTSMMGLLGIIGWEVTVVSSNFISLQLIFSMSWSIHILVRYQELLRTTPDEENSVLLREAVRLTFVPCLYSALTTMAGFCSLVISDILPVVQFGWMMTMGLGVSMLITFLFLPAGLAILAKPTAVKDKEFGQPLTSFFARLTERHSRKILAISFLIILFTAAGAARLEVENSFIDYFKKSTEIYQGMKFIDEQLGGTTPLDIFVEFKKKEPAPAPALVKDDDFSEFAEFQEEEKDPAKYWFTMEKLKLVEKVHDYLDELPATGKVLSLATLGKTARDLNQNKELDNFSTSLLYTAMPEKFTSILVKPYVSVQENQARLTVRIKDSMKDLRRDAMIKKIQKDLNSLLDRETTSFRLSGMMVLYNNMLQSLFDSQIKTIGFTALALMLMFLVLFRSLKISLIALFPNLLSSLSVLGVMGLFKFPLDLMTITIVAISVGMAVDNTIHYLHRFKREIAKDWDYLKAMHRCHGSIGNALYYATITITIGFSILAISNFIPTILFGLLTALALMMAFSASLSLLPHLILSFKPFGLRQEQPLSPADSSLKNDKI